jgi:hypothetical protein
MRCSCVRCGNLELELELELEPELGGARLAE